MTANRQTARTMKRRLSILLSTAALLMAALGSTPVAHAGAAGGQPVSPHEEYVPFVTDFPRSDARAVEAEASAIDWGEVGMAGGIAATLAPLAGSGLVLTRRVRPVRA